MIGHNGRVTDPNEANGDPAIYHHTLGSLIAAFGRLPLEFLSLNGAEFDARHIVPGTLVRLLFFIGVYSCWMAAHRVSDRSRSLLPVLALALAIGMFGQLTASFRGFGAACCGQHALVRQSLGRIALAAGALAIPPLVLP